METIIVPTDFSPAASNAIDYAVELAKFFDARIILVHAYPVPPVNFEVPFSAADIAGLYEVSEKKLLSIRNDIYKKNNFNIAVDYLAEMGTPFEVISATAKAMDADLIVIGIVGEAGRLKERLVGSTAISVARKQEVPTFIIPENAKYQRIRKISFACDLEKTEETDLIYVAKFFSKEFDAELEMVNVEDPLVELTEQKENTYAFIENKLSNTRHKTVHITGRDVVHELEDYFDNFPTDMIMLSPKRHNVFYYLFNNSVTKNLAFHTKVPILAIH